MATNPNVEINRNLFIGGSWTFDYYEFKPISKEMGLIKGKGGNLH